MGFEDLEQKLEKFFIDESAAHDFAKKTRIKEITFARYSAKKSNTWQKLSAFFFQKYVISAVSMAVIIGFIPVLNNQLYAGEISRESGLVEIIRDGKLTILDGKYKLKVGDEIIVSGNANAKLSLRNNFESEIYENTKVKVDSRDSLFLASGKLHNHLQSGKIVTNKGEILAKSSTKFFVDVSASGETKIIPRKNEVSVRNWQGEEIKLSAGEELRLRSDTKISSTILPKDIRLSNIQIQAIRSKLFIARTKSINYIESKISRDFETAEKDLKSAEKTYKSIAQILKTSRDLKTLITRENIDMLKTQDIYAKVAKKTDNKSLLAEVKAVEKLLEIIYKTKQFDLNQANTGVLSFDRYVLVSRLFAKNNPETLELGNILRDQYITSFARKILNEELKIDQISMLNQEIKKLPRTTMSRFFLGRVGEVLPKNLQELLSEKIEKGF